MNARDIREELYSFYLHGDGERSQAFADRCFKILDNRVSDGMSMPEEKMLQYDVITEEFQPVIFKTVPFFYETGVLTSHSDGARRAKGYGFYQANGWIYARHSGVFESEHNALFKKKFKQQTECLYNVCGAFNDTHQHFNLNYRPYLEIGAAGIYERAKAEMKNAESEEEKEFLTSVCHGMLSLKKMEEKFAKTAERMLESESNEGYRRNLSFIADAAARVPWNPPRSFHEALNALVFLRTAVGSLEGIGPNTFGRIDKDLIDFYRNDIKHGSITEDEAYDLICTFLLISDCHYDHDMPMVGYADHELENTYTIGGCDDEGNPIFNEITEMLLRATDEHKIIFPKIKCRFSQSSPREYLELLSAPIAKGITTVLLQNDDATIPALLRSGRLITEARDYTVTGCWGVSIPQEKYDHGSYLNLLKPFEYSIHNLTDKMKEVEISFELINGDESFEELYRKVLRNSERLLDEKLAVTREGGQIFHKADRLPIFSATLEGCLENRKDITMRGAKYNDDYQLIFGLPNIVDSLCAIKKIVYDMKKCTLSQYLDAVRANWEGYEDMRKEATRCPGWGDGSEESCSMAARFNEDLFKIFSTKIGTYGGRVHMGHLTYTEIRWWGEKTLATPDGRRSGEYFAQGLTPSRLKKIPCVNDVINSMSMLDGSMMAANSVINIILPPRIPLDRLVAFLRTVATTATQSLQLNCTSREELLDAQLHPEKYPDLIVRVTGFSAKFTSLSKEWQDEVITRNFYD